MKRGYLSECFKGIAAKRLSAVEVQPEISNQHEFNGVTGLKNIFGSEKKKFNAKFIYLGENSEDTLTSTVSLTWYDSRQAHPTRSEYRLYFQTTAISEVSNEGDLLFLGQKPDGEVLIIVTLANSTIENQLLWLFGLREVGNSFSVSKIEDDKDIQLGFGARYILDELEIIIEDTDENFLEIMLQRFGEAFPTTKVFSKFARESIPEITSFENPDKALLTWMEQEEVLFRTLERYFVAKRLKIGFGQDGNDVDEFISFSLSVQNRRKSRVGHALENHLEEVFREHSLKYSRGKETENKAKPDFIFPGIEQYRDLKFPVRSLNMLGVKTTCKDRWRQVLNEANRIRAKHLLTLEPGISNNQTNEMQASSLQLVIPSELHQSYTTDQQKWLWKFSDFLSLAKENQNTTPD